MTTSLLERPLIDQTALKFRQQRRELNRDEDTVGLSVFNSATYAGLVETSRAELRRELDVAFSAAKK